MSRIYDIAVIGGGINGCGIARDAAGRGLDVLLCEMDDLGGATSAASTKLIHGGLRYLEHREFRLVRHALAEREVLWRMAPHIIWPLRFVLPHRPGLRPAWLLRLGLFIYDHLGGRRLLPGTRTLRLVSDPAGAPLRDVSARGFEYSDCWVQDNRLVVLNAADAAARGADVRVRTACRAARRADGLWHLELEDMASGARAHVSARALVNAAGPWTDAVLAGVLGRTGRAATRLVQGSHIVVPKLFDHDRCYIFQNPDGRIVFAIPYEDDFTLIGTTDRDYTGEPGEVRATAEEIAYLCAAASSYFTTSVVPADVVWTYSGVRALFNDGASAAQETTRDYVLAVDGGNGEAPLLSVFGGKITTYRCLAEDALGKLAALNPAIGRNAGWTARSTLPGGAFPPGGAAALSEELRRAYPFLDARRARRLVHHYGTATRAMLGARRTAAECGRDFGGDLTEAEVSYLMAHEFARTAADVAWRRTKSGLRMTQAQVAALDDWMAARQAAVAA